MAYSTLATVKRYMKQITVGTGRADPVQESDVTSYQSDIDEYIDGRVGDIYAVPIIQITRNGTTKYPEPIPRIAAQLVAATVILNVYTELEPNISAAAEGIRTRALTELDELVNSLAAGSQRLQGQRLKARNRFVRPTIHPQPIPGIAVPPVV